jgi:alginate production protein
MSRLHARASALLPIALVVIAASPLPGRTAAARLNNDRGFEFNAPTKTPRQLTESLWSGSEVVISLEGNDDYDLDRDKDDHLYLLEPEVRIAFAYLPARPWQAYAEFQFDGRAFLSKGEENDESSEGHLRIRQLYALFPDFAPGWSLQFGRQRYKDRWSWWYDERIDAVRFDWRRGDFGVEASAAREKLFRDDLLRRGSEEPVDYYMLVGRYAPDKNLDVSGYLIAKRDQESGDRENPVFLGLQSVGRISSDLRYAVNLATVRGSANGRDIRAFGADLMAAYRFDIPWQPFVTLGVAYGSGDANRAHGVDGNFRQTGLQDNESRTFGRTSFKYYGEVIDPELSNLCILSVGVGVRPLREASAELIYHRYRQVEAADELFDSDLEEDPNGDDRRLGEEVDLVIAYRPNQRAKVSLVLGAFVPGEAFGRDQDPAWLAKLKFGYQF